MRSSSGNATGLCTTHQGGAHGTPSQGGNSFRRMVKTPSVRNALILGVTLQLFQQLAGINTGERERERERETNLLLTFSQ